MPKVYLSNNDIACYSMSSTPRSLSSETDAIVIIPTQSLQQTALRFSQYHPAAAERIYHNTLAVGVVAQYLSLLLDGTEKSAALFVAAIGLG